ncbi:MAG TPA: hypothetical protein VKS99_09800, partial [Blastocatellia bacterium]|nr:hypothetical protein [Blastocatellia bacterium]
FTVDLLPVASFNRNRAERAPREGFAAEQFMKLFVARSNLVNSKIDGNAVAPNGRTNGQPAAPIRANSSIAYSARNVGAT